MSETPDLSKIVNLIMENPSLIAEISALVKTDAEKDEAVSEPLSLPETKATEDEPVSTVSRIQSAPKGERRRQLLCAMKPYLKDERSRAIDSMMSIVEILDMVRSK